MAERRTEYFCGFFTFVARTFLTFWNFLKRKLGKKFGNCNINLNLCTYYVGCKNAESTQANTHSDTNTIVSYCNDVSPKAISTNDIHSSDNLAQGTNKEPGNSTTQNGCDNLGFQPPTSSLSALSTNNPAPKDVENFPSEIDPKDLDIEFQTKVWEATKAAARAVTSKIHIQNGSNKENTSINSGLNFLPEHPKSEIKIPFKDLGSRDTQTETKITPQSTLSFPSINQVTNNERETKFSFSPTPSNPAFQPAPKPQPSATVQSFQTNVRAVNPQRTNRSFAANNQQGRSSQRNQNYQKQSSVKSNLSKSFKPLDQLPDHLTIMSQNVRLPQHAQKKHVYTGKGELTRERANAVSMGRNSEFNYVFTNTVVANPESWNMCSSRGGSVRIVSSTRVKTMHCKRRGQAWEVYPRGKCFAIFGKNGHCHYSEIYKTQI